MVNSRVLAFTEQYFPYYPGGAGKLAWETFSHLVKEGCSVTVISPSNSHQTTTDMVDGVLVHRLPIPGTLSEDQTERQNVSRALAEIERLVDFSQITVLHDFGGFLYHEISPYFSLRYRLPLITHLLLLMGPYSAAEGMPVDFVIKANERQQRSCAAADCVIVTSRSELLLYNAWIGKRCNLVKLVPNAINCIEVPKKNLIDKIRTKYGMNGRVGIYAGGRLLSHAKGFDITCRAIQQALESIPELCLVLTGKTGSSHRFTDSLPKNSVIHCGWLPHNDVTMLQAACEFVVMSPRYEAFGLVALECMANGCIPIVLNIGGLADIVEDSHSGFLVPYACPDMISCWICELYRNCSLRNSVRLNAIQRSHEFSIQRMTQSILNLYRSLHKAK